MKEFFKSVLLMVLTLSTMTMTYWIFSDADSTVEDKQISTEAIDLIDYIRPQNYIFSFGDLFIKLYDDTYENIEVREGYEASLTSFLSSPTEFGMNQITEQIWQVETQKKSLQVNYPLSLEIDDFLRIYNFNMQTANTDGMHVTSVLFMLNHEDYIYLYDQVAGNYYKLYYYDDSLVPDSWITDMFERVDETKSYNDGYRTMESRYNFLMAGLADYDLKTANLLLTPISTQINYPKYNIIQEVDLGADNSSQLDSYAAAVFGDDLNFVKKSIYSDTSTIFMLGYGDKIFKATNDGSLEVTMKPKDTLQKKSIGFLDGMELALREVLNLGLPSDTLYLSGYYQSESRSAIESVYLFNYSKNGIPLYDPDRQTGALIEVRFSNKDMVKIKKRAPIITSEKLSNFQSVKSFSSIIQRNRISFEKAIEQETLGFEVEKEDLLQMALHNMETLSLKYYVKGDTLIPVWYIKIGKTHYFIDLTSGLVLNQYQDEE